VKGGGPVAEESLAASPEKTTLTITIKVKARRGESGNVPRQKWRRPYP
jgi:hypothetical protein